MSEALSKLDFQQIIKSVYDIDTNRLRTDASVSMGGGSMEIIISQDNDSIRVGDGVNLITGTTLGAKHGLDVFLTNGDITPTGLRLDLKAQKIIITDVPTAVPATALTQRNGISVRVWGPNTVFFGSSDVTADEGYPKKQYEEINMDIRDTPGVILYAVCLPGQSCEIRVFEVA